MKIDHLDRCPRERTETFVRQGATVTRCIDCGAQTVARPEEPPAPEVVQFEPMHGPLYREVHIYE